MTSDRFGAVVRQLVAVGVGRRPMDETIGAASDRMLDTPHCGVIVLDAAGDPTTMASSTPLMETVEELELTLGAGPCLSASRGAGPVAEPDLALADPARWLGFCGAAFGAGARGAFAFPLMAAGGSFGSLNVIRVRAGRLTETEHKDGLAVASVVAHLLITEGTGGWAAAIDDAMDHQAVVHQATGMVGTQLDVSMTFALAVLRARAFSDNRPVVDLAREVVDRRLRFDERT